MKALTVLLSVVPGIGCYLGLIDGGYGVIEEIKIPAVAGALMSRLIVANLLLFSSNIPRQPRLPAPLH